MGDPRGMSGILIVRAWSQPRGNALRIRLTRVADGRERPVVTATSPEEACLAVQRWLEDVFGSPTVSTRLRSQ
jgi:hypothetical protein